MRRRALLAIALALAPMSALAGESAKGGKATPGETYMVLPSINTSIATRYGGRTVLTVEVGLDIPDPALREQAGLVTPRLRGAFLEVVQSYGATLAPGAPPNADLLAQRLQQSADQALGKSGARLLLGSLVIN